MITTTFSIEGGDTVVVVVHDNLTIDRVYDHLVRQNIYGYIRSTGVTTTVKADVVNDFLKDLR